MADAGGYAKKQVDGLVITLLLLVLGVIVLRTAWVCDDAYVSFRTVDNFVNGYGLTWNTDERVQAFTNPLWVLVMSLLYVFTHDVYFTSIFLSLFLGLTAVWLILRYESLSNSSAVLVASVLTCSRAFVEYSTSGLENALSYFLAAVFAVVFLRRPRDSRTLFWLSLVAAFGAVNRLDTLLLFGPALLMVWWRTPKAQGAAAMAMGFAPLMLWELFSIVYYGFPFPNTYYAKLHTGIGAGAYAAQGLIYLMDSFSVDPLTLLAILAAFVVVCRANDRPTVPIMCGVLLYLLYIVRVGGDFMSGRFLSVPLLLSVIPIARWRIRGGVLARIAPVTVVLFLAVGTEHSPVRAARNVEASVVSTIAPTGIADEKAYYSAGTALANTYRSSTIPVHSWLNQGLVAGFNAEAAPVVTFDAIGFYGFSCGPKVHVVDRYGLGDPLLARLPIRDVTYWRIGHFERDVPEGYIASLCSGENRISDSNLADYYNHLAVIVRGKVFSRERFREIWRMNLGYGDSSLDKFLAPPSVSVSAERVDSVRSEGTCWDAPGNIVLTRGGLRVNLYGVSHSRAVEVSLDHNDRYRLDFCRDSLCLASVVIPMRSIPGGGLRLEKVGVPSTAREGGYSSILVMPLSGDSNYSLGHLRLVEDSAAAH